MINLLNKYPESIIRIEGNCDPRDVDGVINKSNMELSEKRANSVMQTLADSTKLNKGQFRTTGFSDLYQVSQNPEEYQLDRRADIFITPQRYIMKKIFKGRDFEALMLNDNYVRSLVDSLRVEAAENNTYTTVSGFPEYKVGPLDVLRIVIWEGRNAKEYIVKVNVDGSISFAFISKMMVQNLTPTQIANLLIDEFSEYYLSLIHI